MTEDKPVFADRRHAGIELAKLLESKYNNEDAIVFGIPRGGVAIACELAKRLNAELSVIITKKLPHPQNPELAIGSVAEDGSMFLNSNAQGIDREVVRDVMSAQLREMKRRVEQFRKGKPLPNMYNRTVIIADDGIATGSTIVSAIKLCKTMKAAKVIVTSPVSGRKYLEDIDQLADDVIIAEKPRDFVSVSQIYKSFPKLSDEDVLRYINS